MYELLLYAMLPMSDSLMPNTLGFFFIIKDLFFISEGHAVELVVYD